jgi:hypothetical protein
MAGSRLARLGITTGTMAFAALQTACYSLRPITGATPGPGTMVAFDLNDAGRAALGPTIGSEVKRVTGTVVRQDAGDFLVSVAELEMLRGGTQVWRGEQIRIQPGYIGTTYQRRFSATRTIALGAVAAGGIALLVTQGIKGFSNPDDTPTPTDTGQTIRIPRP